MRIIGGSCRGRRLLAPGRRFVHQVRPTSDRAREGLFNIIRERVAGAKLLDLFAGTGALGLEALSRGADSALFLEHDPQVYGLLVRNLKLCGFTDPVARAVRRDCSGSLRFLDNLAPPGGFSLIMADPPYGRGLAAGVLRGLATLFSRGAVLAVGSLVVLETGSEEKLPPEEGELRTVKEPRRYGEALFHFYQAEEL